MECLVLSSLDRRGFHFICPGPAGADGVFSHPEIAFEVKTLIAPDGTVERLVEMVRRWAPVPVHVTWHGDLGFNKQLLRAVLGRIREWARTVRTQTTSRLRLPEVKMELVAQPIPTKARWSEGWFDPYAWAEANQNVIKSSLLQIQRYTTTPRKTLIVYAFHPEVPLAGNEELMERAYARRVLVGKARDSEKPDHVLRKLGGMVFASDLAKDTDRLAVYLNPNALTKFRIDRHQLEAMTDFDLGRFDWIDDFAHDNY